MWSWRSGKGKSEEDPLTYSLLKEVPSRPLPQELVDQECSATFHEWRDEIECDLVAAVTDEKAPAFATFLKAGPGLLQINLPDSGEKCLLIFSTPVRAADYASVAMPDQRFEYFCSSAEQTVSVIKEFHDHAGIKHIALDRCPRCDIFTALGAANMNSAAKVITTWKISKATEMARLVLYFDYAQNAAKAGKFMLARDVALETVGHVTLEDPRLHLLLGKLAVQLGDKQLLREAIRFLGMFKQEDKLKELQAAQKAKVVPF